MNAEVHSLVDIREPLVESARVTATALPDGSVDRRFRLVDDDGNRLTRTAVGEAITAGAKTFDTADRRVETGGQSVNAADQLHALGATTTLVGHLDHPVFEICPYQTYSMGKPADINVYELADGVVMIGSESADIETWTETDLYEAVGTDLSTIFERDVVVWTNWATMPQATAAFEAVMGALPKRLVIDPGPIELRTPQEQNALIEALNQQALPDETILSPNAAETRLLAQAIDDSITDTAEAATRLQRETELAGVIVHGHPQAIIATASETVAVPALENITPGRHAGAGDRFTAAVAYAIARDWSYKAATTLGHLVAGQYLQYGHSGSRRDVLELLNDEL